MGPDEQRREAMAKALAGPQATIARGAFERYPEVDELAEIIEGDYDVVIVHLDPDPEPALDVIESSVQRQQFDHGDGPFGAPRSGVAGALHARRRARVSERTRASERRRRGAGARFGPPG